MSTPLTSINQGHKLGVNGPCVCRCFNSPKLLCLTSLYVLHEIFHSEIFADKIFHSEIFAGRVNCENIRWQKWIEEKNQRYVFSHCGKNGFKFRTVLKYI